MVIKGNVFPVAKKNVMAVNLAVENYNKKKCSIKQRELIHVNSSRVDNSDERLIDRYRQIEKADVVFPVVMAVERLLLLLLMGLLAAAGGHDRVVGVSIAAGVSLVHNEDASKEKLGLLTVHCADKLSFMEISTSLSSTADEPHIDVIQDAKLTPPSFHEDKALQMELNRLCLVVIMIINVVVLIQGWRCHGCLEEERTALLQIKDAFNYPNGKFLSSWGKDANCCDWKQVECNSSTLRVVRIDLSYSRGWEVGDLLLNASLFLPFPELNSLNLYGNRIAGCLEKEGFERLSVLGNLETLQLGQNKFNGSILSSLGGLSSLKYLCLKNNEIKGAISVEGLNNLTSLRHLRISSNHIEGFKSFHGALLLHQALYNLVFTGGEDEPLKLSNLEYLELRGNRFDNSILSSFKGLSSLKNLDLSKNQLKGSFNMKVLFSCNPELEALSNLTKLYLSGNEIDEFVFSSRDVRGFGKLSRISLFNITSNRRRRISHSLVQSLAKFTLLKTLDLGDNNLEGATLAQGELQYPCSLKNLQKLDLSSSTLDNSLLQTIGRITTLKSLKLNGCRLSGNIPIAQGLCELKHLKSLDISNNSLSGALPTCLANLTSLERIDLSSNQFVGDISSSPLINLTSIRELRLSDNHFQIPISMRSFFNHSELKYFFGSNNDICEEPEEYNLIPKFQLERLHLSGQVYGGALPFPRFLYYQYNMREIYFYNMKMKGGIPNWLLENNTNLDELVMVNISLSGPFQLPNHPRVNLSHLDISDNHFDSHIPAEIGSYFPSLTFLSMSKNNFSGGIPSSFGKMSSLQVLDLSENNISGTLPPCFSSLPLVHVYLSHNKLQGSLEDAFHNSFELITLDLSHNQLTGKISEWIGEVSHMSFLLLGYNKLEGKIPDQLCKLDKLSYIDLSHNMFSGDILPCLKFRSSIWYSYLRTYPDRYLIREPLEITTKSVSYSYSTSILNYMSGMDLSCNYLTGEIPLEIGNLPHIHALNLSNNVLTGHIPQSFSNLSDVESLDLSNNSLTGELPPGLVQLHSLAVFSVAHNNLSGRTPAMIPQFSTFNQSSYEGNPFLCGPPLSRNCTPEEEAPSLPDVEESGFMDTYVFHVTFAVTYIVMLVVTAAILYINPNWRRSWFHFIQQSINHCYYFFVDNLLMPSWLDLRNFCVDILACVVFLPFKFKTELNLIVQVMSENLCCALYTSASFSLNGQ
uniref:Leucine-rich repeat-containing N-terminal plant-type domain-containing protein n=1 Tax=Salix viminalis TaxID=40686 RepID=A0A6N2KNT5_SALVM